MMFDSCETELLENISYFKATLPIRILLFHFSESALCYRLLDPRVLECLCGLEALVRLPLEAACEE